MTWSRKPTAVCLAMALFLVIPACGSKQKPPPPPKSPPPAAEEPPEEPAEAQLQADCFEGDQDACDKLGH